MCLCMFCKFIGMIDHILTKLRNPSDGLVCLPVKDWEVGMESKTEWDDALNIAFPSWVNAKFFFLITILKMNVELMNGNSTKQNKTKKVHLFISTHTENF